MNDDFSRVLGLLRQENGIREPGLAFVAKACDYYHVSADYLLGRTGNRDGAIIEADELIDASEAKESLKGSIMAKLQKKLIVNSVSVLFDLLGRTGSKDAVSHAGAYLSSAIYQLFRPLHRAAGANDSFFGLSGEDFDMDLLSADMNLTRIRYVKALAGCEEGRIPAADVQSLTAEYQGMGQAVAQVMHSTDERAKGLE